jgi:predicted Zn-dependent peptidase
MSPTKATPKKAAPKKTAAKKTAAKKAAAVEGPRAIPTVGPMPKLRVPTPAVRVLPNGLTVIAVRRPGIPLVQARMVLPTSRPKISLAEKARQRVLGRTLLGGTSTRTQAEIADQLQRLGGNLSAGADAEDLTITGTALSVHLPALLATIHEVLTDAAFPKEVVVTERSRTAQELQVARTQPEVQAAIAFGARVFGGHPYGEGLPEPEDVEKVTASQLSSYLKGRVGPMGGNLVLVSDLTTKRVLDLAERALGGWTSGSPAQTLPTPPQPEPGPIVLIDRPGSVQTSIRVGGIVPGRAHPDNPALALATTVFGGYFSSRLVHNLREDKGWTYSPHAGIDHLIAASQLSISADVGTEFTAPALVEITHELGRMASVAVDQAELDSARSYRSGALAIGLQTQSGLATQLAVLAAGGLDASYLEGLPGRFAQVTVDDVLRAAQTHLAPARLVTVLVGDAEKILPSVEAIAPVTVKQVE